MEEACSNGGSACFLSLGSYHMLCYVMLCYVLSYEAGWSPLTTPKSANAIMALPTADTASAASVAGLPSWWPRVSDVLLSDASSPGAAIQRGAAAFDAAAVASLLCSRQFVVLDGFLGAVALSAVRDGIVAMERGGKLREGKIQHGLTQNSDHTARSDRICFLAKDGEGSGEALRCYAQQIDRIRARLSSHAPLVELVGGELDGCNYMAASYPGGGARYVKHRDALPYKAGRKLTVIYYLNPGWQPAHGGELRIWPPDGSEPVVVAPRADRLVLFVSSLEHEVLPAWRPRYALTTWMFNRKHTALEALAEDMRQKKASGKLNTAALLAALDADSDFDDTEEEEEEEESEGEGEEKLVDNKAAMSVLLRLMQQKKNGKPPAKGKDADAS